MEQFFTIGACLVGVVFLLFLWMVLRSVRMLYEYERGVVFQLGRYKNTRNPGLTIIWPTQTMRKVDMRIKTADIPRQEVMTRDNIPMLVNAVVYFKVVKPEDAIIKIEDYVFAVKQYTQAALRDVIGNAEMDFVLTEREQVAESIQKIVDTETIGWGVDVELIKIQEVELPAEMKRAMAKQAEAERERRADDHRIPGRAVSFRKPAPGRREPLSQQRGAAPAHPADHPGYRCRPLRKDHPAAALRDGETYQLAGR